MKKLILIAAVLASACALTSCEGIQAANEDEEIDKGKLFLIEKAQIKYDNGLVYAFKENGKLQYIKEAGSTEHLIIKDKQFIYCDEQDKTYSETSYGSSYMTSFVVTEVVLSIDANYKKSSEKIAGQNCNVYTPQLDTTEPTLASYKRIRMMDKNGKPERSYEKESWYNNKAVEFSTNVDDTLFSLEGYKDKWHTFD